MSNCREVSKIEVIAEIANAHQGDPEQALELALRSLEAGAHAVKFQVYFAHELLVRTHPRFDHFQKQSFSRDVWRHVIRSVKKYGGIVYCDVFGLEAFAVASELNVDGFKVHSSDLGNHELLSKIAREGNGRIFLSTGGSTAPEIARAINLVRKCKRPTLLHGFQGYPTKIEDSILKRLVWLKTNFGNYADIGYQDHTDGEDKFALIIPLLAVGLGATVIEKHVTLNRSAKGVDYFSSVEPQALKSLVRDLQITERAIGNNPEHFSASEHQYRKTVKKHWVAARALPQGRILQASDFLMKRIPDDSKHAIPIQQLIDRRLLRPAKEEEALSRSDIKTVTWVLVVARFASRRLPGKALMNIAGMPALQHLLKRIKQAKSVDRIVLCTTTQEEDSSLAELATREDVAVHRGQVEDVLGRMLGAIRGHDVDVVVRVTGDDILVDPEYLDQGLSQHLQNNAEYSDLKELPSGTEVEFFDVNLLEQLYLASQDVTDTEYLTSYIDSHRDQYRTQRIAVQENHRRDWRLTLDTVEDSRLLEILLLAMRSAGRSIDYRLADIVNFFEKNPDALKINNITQSSSVPHVVNTNIEWARLVS
jgi:N,N'-diacetyllegionaminate synthase